MFPRTETRKEHYQVKQKTAQRFPVSVAAVNFSFDQNIAFLTRAVACYGACDMHIIGKKPDYDTLRRYSGGTNNFVEFKTHSNPLEFLKWVRIKGCKLVCAELCEDATSIFNYRFDQSAHTILVVGNETDGIPVEILNASDKVFIPMMGTGYSLNTSQCANVLLYEYIRQRHT